MHCTLSKAPTHSHVPPHKSMLSNLRKDLYILLRIITHLHIHEQTYTLILCFSQSCNKLQTCLHHHPRTPQHLYYAPHIHISHMHIYEHTFIFHIQTHTKAFDHQIHVCNMKCNLHFCLFRCPRIHDK
jgi:hypothetical protein